MKRKFTICISAFLALSLSAHAYIVENFSFELPGDVKHNNWEDVPGWSSDTVASDSGVESDWPGSTDGVWAGYIMAADPSVWQLTDTVIQAGQAYLLIVDAQNNWSEGTAELMISLYYDDGGTRMGASSVLVNPGSPWETFQLWFMADDMPAAIGSQIGIEIDNVSAGASWMGLDNIRLVPEPATLALLAIGGLSMLRCKR